MRDDISAENNLHKLASILLDFGRGLSSAKQHQNIVKEGEHNNHYGGTYNDIEQDGICQSSLGGALVSLAEAE